MIVDDFKPDYIVGIVRGGNVPAMYLSQYLNDTSCKMINVKIAGNKEFHGFKFIVDEIVKYNKKILIVDDINDTGFTFSNLKHHVEQYAISKNVSANLIYLNVKTAALVSNTGSSYEVDYYSKEINKNESDCWVVFPWEDWWER